MKIRARSCVRVRFLGGFRVRARVRIRFRVRVGLGLGLGLM